MKLDALVVGSGPNGLAAAIRLAQAGWRVRVIEGAPAAGGGARSGSLTLPGFVHDLGSAVHPLTVASPFFQSLNLSEQGLRFAYPPVAAAHPLDEGAVLLKSSVEETAAGLGADEAAYLRLVAPLAARWEELFGENPAPGSPLAAPPAAARSFRRPRATPGRRARAPLLSR